MERSDMRDGGGVISRRGVPFEGRDCHPTPPLLSVPSTLPLQGEGKNKTGLHICAFLGVA